MIDDLAPPPPVNTSNKPDSKPATKPNKTTRTDLRTNLVTVKLNDAELAILDKLSEQYFVGKSTVFRQLLSGNIKVN
jgi:hypothetical protein